VFNMECEFDNTNMVGTPIEWRYVSDKQNVQIEHKPRLFLTKQRCCQNYIIRTCCHPGFPISSFCLQLKYIYNEIHSNPVIGTSVFVKPHLKR
jgi:hypothetical protein